MGRFEKALRLQRLPAYLFSEIDKKKKKAIEQGADIINLGIGDPDLPTPEVIIEELYKAAKDPANHKYALDEGMEEFRIAATCWFKRRFNVEINYKKEILPLIGSKEGIAHLPLGFVNPKDICIIPQPCYPPYRSGTIFAGGEPYYVELKQEKGFLPDIENIPLEIYEKAKIFYINYPNNPTAAFATKDFFEKLVKLAKKYNFLIAHDAAYSEVYFEEKPCSILEIEGAKDVCIEFHSLSKTFNMTGWRIGFAVGSEEIISILLQVKSNIDSGIFQAIQKAGTKAYELYEELTPPLREIYKKRRDILCNGLNSLGWKVEKPKGTFYCWIPVPEGFTSGSLCEELLEKCAIVTTPGEGFGGEESSKFIRATITVHESRLEEAVERIKKHLTF